MTKSCETFRKQRNIRPLQVALPLVSVLAICLCCTSLSRSLQLFLQYLSLISFHSYYHMESFSMGFFLPPDLSHPGSSNIKIFGLSAGFPPALSLICHVINLGLLYIERAAFIVALGVATWHSRSLILPILSPPPPGPFPILHFRTPHPLATLPLSITLSTPSIMFFFFRSLCPLSPSLNPIPDS